MASKKKTGKAATSGDLLTVLEARFAAHPERHKGITWATVAERIAQQPKKRAALQAMEDTGGEPDVIGVDAATGAVVFCDCSAQSPSGRRSVCYDAAALAARKENKPKDSAVNMAKTLGIELLTEAQYRALQTLGAFDTTTSSWVQTPKAIRDEGGAVFCDCRYNHVFYYHNGADSYYAARGFRGQLKI